MISRTRLVVAASVAVLTACAPPIVLDPVAPTPGERVDDTESPTIELRYFSFSPTVSVVSWPAEENWYGLRASVRRDGSLVRDHRLYVSTYFEPWMRTMYRAAIPPRGLQMLGVSRDSHACYFGRCSPFETLSVRVPDEVLRTTRDSVTVTFYGSGNRQLMVTLRRGLIDPYLASVDSVSAALRRLHQKT
jgi:hypothetical protein